MLVLVVTRRIVDDHGLTSQSYYSQVRASVKRTNGERDAASRSGSELMESDDVEPENQPPPKRAGLMSRISSLYR
jgi:hypothetical protein